MNKQTVWIQDGEGEFSHNDFSSTHNFNLKEHTGYFLTEEDMRELLSSTWDNGFRSSNIYTVPNNFNKEQYLNNLLTNK
jgi:hypothetical protein